MKNETKDFFTNEGGEINIGVEEIVLAPDEEIYAKAAEIAATSADDVKYPFILKYNANEKEFLLDILNQMGGIAKEEIGDSELVVSVNMEQLKFIKSLYCVEGVRVENIDKSLKSESFSTETEDESILTNTAASDIMTTEAQISDVATLSATVETSPASTNTTSSLSTTSSCGTCGNTVENAILLTVEESKFGQINCPESEIWYKFNIDDSDTYTIFTSGSLTAGIDLDTIGTLYDSNGYEIASNDDHDGMLYFKIQAELLEGNTYYVKVRAYGDKTGSFYIRVTKDVLVESVTISPSSVTLAKNQTVQLEAEVLPINAVGRNVRWISSDDNIATVDWQTGMVTAVDVGTTTILAYDWYERAQVAHCTINVSNSPNYGWPVYPKPHIHMRKYWGARDVIADRLKERTRAPLRIIFHHTANNFSDTDFIKVTAEMQRLQNNHIDDRKKCDIAYHFLIDPAGGIWQGAEIDNYQRGHAEGYFDDIGVAVMGNFENSDFSKPQDVLNDNQKDAMIKLSKWLCYEYDLPIDEANNISPITTHRKVVTTKCPGKNAGPWMESDLKNIMNDWLKNYYK